ncbi:MAG: hypothetical protein GX895_11335 [Clostridiales bacterium]|nr:hypothetical protein [Clostridiales bacterium]
MICSNCNNEFNYIEGLKFCPYCGCEIGMQLVNVNAKEDLEKDIYEEKPSLENSLGDNFESNEKVQEEKGVEETAAESEGFVGNIHDTLRMPPITDEMLKINKKKRKKDKKSKLQAIKRFFTNKIVIISSLTVMVLALVIYIGSSYLLNQKVDEVQIQKDILGRIILLPKGTNFQVKEEYIKSISIGERVYNDEEKVEYIDLNATLNDGKIEVSGVFQLSYKKDNNRKWQLLDPVALKKDIIVKPVAGMEEAALLEELKKKNITLLGQQISLSDSMVTSIEIVERKPQFEEGKENILLSVSVDGGVLAAKGRVNSSFSFVDEKWIIDEGVSLNEESLEISLSEKLSEEAILKEVKSKGQRQNVKHDSIFGGQTFLVNDKFTQSTSIQSKALSDDKNQLYVSIKKENLAGSLKTILSVDYVFDVSLTKLTYNSNSEPKIEDVSVGDLTREMIVASLAGAEIEGRRGIFWWDNNHEITGDEAKTYKEDEILSKAGYKNIKYVYGKITYNDGEEKTVDMVAIYYLTYDNDNGYKWMLDSVVSSESSKYKHYSKENLGE